MTLTPEKTAGITAVALVAILGVSACTSDADRASENLSKAAESFELNRTIVGVNGITGELTFYAEGRCSFEYPSSRRIDVTCKTGPGEIKRHTFVMGDQDSVVVSQEEPADADEYHSRIIIKPQNIIPSFDLQVGNQ